MLAWFYALPLIGQLWLVYATGALSLLGLATVVEFKGQKVDGAGGWFLFAALMLSFYGFLLMLPLSLAVWLLQRLL